MIDVNFSEIEAQVKDVISYSQGLSPHEISCREIISQWWENKSWLYGELNNNLIWESPEPVSIHMTDEIKDTLVKNFIEITEDFLYGELVGEPSDEDYRSEIEDWIVWIRANQRGFFNNSVVDPLPGEREMKQGMKLIKAFKFFNFPEDVIRKLQDMASQIIQQNKIEGILCFSIHPLDFLSLSDNESKWRSCHALDGEYRAGNLSYMIDPSTVVCYLKSTHDVQLERFPKGLLWNNKKWRVLFHIHREKHIAYVNRQYPFNSEQLIFEAQSTPIMIRMGFDESRLYFQTHGFREVNGHFLNQNYFSIHGYVVNPKEMCGGDEQSLQYNDFVSSPHYRPQYILSCHYDGRWPSSKEVVEQEFKVEIGKRVPCLCGCGNYLDDSCKMICDNCQEDSKIGYCSICWDEIYNVEEYAQDEDGRLYCESCARNRGLI